MVIMLNNRAHLKGYFNFATQALDETLSFQKTYPDIKISAKLHCSCE